MSGRIAIWVIGGIEDEMGEVAGEVEMGEVAGERCDAGVQS